MMPRVTFLPAWFTITALMVISPKVSFTSSTVPVTVRVSPMNTGFTNLDSSLSRSLLDELCHDYNVDDASKLYVMACLKVLYPGIAYSDMDERYAITALKEKIGDVALSKNTISTFINNVGRNYSRIVAFMRNRTREVRGHLVAVDGTVKSDNSEVNSLSQYSRKARIRGSKDISILYAYDTQTLEPICAKAYLGNVLDIVAYEDFLMENDISNAIIMGDKAFQRSAAERAFNGNESLHFLNPLKRSDKRIETNKMHEYDGMLSLMGKDILYKKASLPHSFLYSFYDRSKGAKEEKDYFKRHKEDDTFDKGEYALQMKRFGTVVFESDVDAPAEDIYRMYSSRWLIETTFRYYKTVLELDDTRVHDDYSVYGNEFVNFLATVITMRLVKKFDEVKLTEKMTYSEIMAELKSAKKIRMPDGSKRNARTTQHTMETLALLGIEPREDGSTGLLPKRKRGRPKKTSI